MKSITILCLIFSLMVVGGTRAAVIDESLQDELNQLSAGDFSEALVMFTHQANIPALDKQLKAEHASLAERNRRVVLALQQAATETQPEVVSFLENLKSQGMVESYRMFWIANMFQVKATGAGINAIAARQDLETMYLDFPIENITPVKAEPENTIESVEIGLDRINAPAAWAMGWTGAGRVVMNIDTGVDGTHPALAARFRGDVNGNGTYEESWFDPYDTHWPFPQDSGEHGTHTMGTICGRSDAGDTIGVAIDAQWIAAAPIDRESISRTVSDALLSFQWAADPDGDPNTQDNPDACGNSWGLTTSHGYPPCDQTFWQAIDNLEFAGTAVIFSAGNEGYNGLRRPADRGTTPYNCFAVGAVDGSNPNLPIASFSSRGPTNCGPNGETVIKPEVVAPGVNVRSARPGGGYQTMSGTSMASPHVTGAVAVIRQVNPDLTVDEIKEILMATAHDLPFSNPNGEDNDYGHGIIDLYDACVMAQSSYGYMGGNVVDNNGQGIGGALIEVMGTTRSTRTDENGDYFMGVPGDTSYAFRVSYFGYIPVVDTVDMNTGDTVSMDFTLLSAPGGDLHGTVINAEDSSPIPGANIEIADTPLDPVQTDSSGNYFFPDIPGGSTYLVRARASGFGIGQDSIMIPVGGNPQLDFALSRFESFENDNGGWAGEGTWEWGTPSSGPGSAFDGTNVWATSLSGNYPSNSNDWLVTKYFLIEDNIASISFYGWYDMQSGIDGGNVSISSDGGYTWTLIEPTEGYPDQDITALDYEPGFTGTSDWAQEIFDINGYAGQVVKFRFRFASNNTTNSSGWYLDAFDIDGGGDIPAGNPEITYNPASFNVQLQPDMSTDRTLTISNNGDGYLIYSLSPVTDLLTSLWQQDNPSVVTGTETANVDDINTVRQMDGDFLTVTYTGEKTSSLEGEQGPPLVTDFGGPDNFGHMWYDSDEPNGPEYNWVDITSIGQQLSFSDDQNQGPFSLGFTMPFYENSYNNIRICSNGWLSFTSTVTTYTNDAIPNGLEPNNMIAPFWDDLNPSQGGNIYFYTNNQDTAIVEYNNVPHFGGSGVYTFEAILTAGGNIIYQYQSVSGLLNSATIGIENIGGTDGLQVVYNQSYVTNNLAVMIKVPMFWLSTDPVFGYALEGESNDITVNFDATDMDEGEYSGYVAIETNDANNPTVSIPCTLTVSSVVGIDDISDNIPTTFKLDQNYPNPFNPSTDINFALPRPGEVNLAVYDLLGRLVKTLVAERLNAGYHTVTWNGDDRAGHPVASGIYFYRIEAGDFNMTRKMIMLK